MGLEETFSLAAGLWRHGKPLAVNPYQRGAFCAPWALPLPPRCASSPLSFLSLWAPPFPQPGQYTFTEKGFVCFSNWICCTLSLSYAWTIVWFSKRVSSCVVLSSCIQFSCWLTKPPPDNLLFWVGLLSGMFGLYTFLGRRVLALQAKLNTTANSSATDDMWVYLLIDSPVEIHMPFNRPYETLNTPQRHQSRTREAFRQRNINVDESPRRCRTPATRPETPTPPPGAAESARMQARQSARDIWDNDLEDSPRRRRPGESQDENQPLSVSSSGGSVMRHGLGTRVRHIIPTYVLPIWSFLF